MKFVNVYKVDRRYGGPEEGGWWYNHYNCIDTEEVPKDQVEGVVEAMEKKHKGKSHGDIYSVLGGLEVHVLVEDSASESETTERPRYE